MSLVGQAQPLRSHGSNSKLGKAGLEPHTRLSLKPSYDSYHSLPGHLSRDLSQTGIFDSKARAASRDQRSESDHHSRLGQHRVLSTKSCQHIGWQISGRHLAASSLPLQRATAVGAATATCEKQPWAPQLLHTPVSTPACQRRDTFRCGHHHL